MTDPDKASEPRSNETIQLRGPSVFSNKFYVIKGDLVTRIIFGDEPAAGSDSIYHSSIVLPNADAKQLAEIILDLMKK